MASRLQDGTFPSGRGGTAVLVLTNPADRYLRAYVRFSTTAQHKTAQCTTVNTPACIRSPRQERLNAPGREPARLDMVVMTSRSGFRGRCCRRG